MKKFMALALMVLTLAACGNKTDNVEGTISETVVSNEVEVETEAAVEETISEIMEVVEDTEITEVIEG